MNKCRLILILFLFVGSNCFVPIHAQELKQIIRLSWEEVVNKSLSDNLTLKSKNFDYEAQNYEVFKSLFSFLPTFNYQGVGVNNLELPVTIIPPTPPIFPEGARITFGTRYTFQHSLNLSMPLFAGGLRYFNYNLQKSIEKSLREELKGMEDETAFTALQSYFSIILSRKLAEASGEATEVAIANLRQVEKFYDAGRATQLDLQRAKAQYYSTLPQYESALNQFKLSAQNLKFLLNISLNDSLEVSDTLRIMDFLKEYSKLNLNQYKNYSRENNSALRAVEYRLQASRDAEDLVISQFFPTINLNLGVQHLAQLENSHVAWNDYIRSKSIALSATWELFDGGRRYFDLQKAKIQSDQAEILRDQLIDQTALGVEQSFYKLDESLKNLNSLEQTLLEAKESLRLANLLYAEGAGIQVEVLSAQLFYTQSKLAYLRGIFDYNINQLSLMKETGLLKKLWE